MGQLFVCMSREFYIFRPSSQCLPISPNNGFQNLLMSSTKERSSSKTEGARFFFKNHRTFNNQETVFAWKSQIKCTSVPCCIRGQQKLVNDSFQFKTISAFSKGFTSSIIEKVRIVSCLSAEQTVIFLNATTIQEKHDRSHLFLRKFYFFWP